MKHLKIWLALLLVLWIIGVYYWVNKIDNIYYRAGGILGISLVAYGLGKLHQIMLGEREIEAEGGSVKAEPSFI